MAVQEVQGADIEFLVRQADTGLFKRMVCEDSLTLDISNDVTTVKTKTCGAFKGVQTPDFKANGSAVFNVTPTSTEVSYDQVATWQNDVEKVEWIIRNIAFGSTVAGDAIRFSGYGYFVNSQFVANNGEVAKFTWNLEGVGTLNVTES